jgi:hypothetical protein
MEWLDRHDQVSRRVEERKRFVNAVPRQLAAFHQIFPLSVDGRPFASGRARIRILEFESANPTIVKSIKQRDFLNTWLRLYARTQVLPRIDEFQPARMEEELPDLVFLSVEKAEAARLIIERDGARMTSAFGNSGAGRYLDEYFGHRLAPLIMPIYQECLRRALPVYSIAEVDDVYGRKVAYERLLLPFSDQGGVTHVLASLKTISEDGGFEIRNLMRGNDSLPTTSRRAVIDRELFHRAPGRIAAGDLIEFN